MAWEMLVERRKRNAADPLALRKMASVCSVVLKLRLRGSNCKPQEPAARCREN